MRLTSLLGQLDARLTSRRLTRFAPAPTGALHLGHVANAVYVWGLARSLGAEVALRIEDHDRQRCRPGYEAALLDDLDWLAFVPDRFPTEAFRKGACDGRQRDREPFYRATLDRLVARGLVYGCVCTRRQIEEAADTAASSELRYPGTCRDAGHPLAEGSGWRLRLDDEEVTFEDALAGIETQRPARQGGDVLIRDRLGNWTYQFAAVVDDTIDEISLVVRGVDLLSSTGRQILMARMLGRHRPPVFAHHPLIMKSPTEKLSKSDGDTGVADLRRGGWTPERTIGEAAWRVGLQPSPEPVSAGDVAALFTG